MHILRKCVSLHPQAWIILLNVSGWTFTQLKFIMTALDFLSVRCVFVCLPPVPISSSSAHPSSALVTARLLASSGYPTSCSHNSLRVSSIQDTTNTGIERTPNEDSRGSSNEGKTPFWIFVYDVNFFRVKPFVRLSARIDMFIWLSDFLSWLLESFHFCGLNFVNFSLFSFLFFLSLLPYVSPSLWEMCSFLYESRAHTCCINAPFPVPEHKPVSRLLDFRFLF